MIRLQADADFRMAIIKGLRRRQSAIDIQTADDANLRGLADPLVLALAGREGRILLSHDASTMQKHFAKYLEDGNTSPGVIIIRQQVPIGIAIEILYIAWEASSSEDWENRLSFLP